MIHYNHTRCLAVNDTVLEYVGSCNYVSASNQTLPCTAWEYDRTYYQSTIVTDVRSYSFLFKSLLYVQPSPDSSPHSFVQWNLVCDRRWMASVAQSAYMLGALIASSLLGQLSDR